MKLLTLLCAGLYGLIRLGTAHAEDAPQSKAFQDWLSGNGVSVSYIGAQGGVSGYLAKSNGHTQTIYVWPNNHDIVIGQMFNGAGDDITARQLDFLTHREDQKKNGLPMSVFPSPKDGAVPGLNADKIDGMRFAIKNHDIIKLFQTEGDGSNSPIGFVISAPSKKAVSQNVYATPNGEMVIAGKHLVFDQNIGGQPNLEPILDVAKSNSSPAEVSQTSINTDSAVQQGLPPASAVVSPTGNVIAESGGLVPTPIMGPAAEPQEVPMDLFVGAAKSAAWLPIPAKAAPTAATLWFIADPASPATVAVWKQLLPLIYAKKLAVRLILVDGSQQSITDNLAILGSKNPGETWQSIIDGHEPPPVEPGNSSYQRATDWLNDNAAFVKEIHVSATPFLAYMGANMTFVSQLNPPNIADFLSDLP